MLQPEETTCKRAKHVAKALIEASTTPYQSRHVTNGPGGSMFELDKSLLLIAISVCCLVSGCKAIYSYQRTIDVRNAPKRRDLLREYSEPNPDLFVSISAQDQ